MSRGRRSLRLIQIGGGLAVFVITVVAGTDGPSLVDWSNVFAALAVAGLLLFVGPLFAWWLHNRLPLRVGPIQVSGPLFFPTTRNGLLSMAVGGSVRRVDIKLQPGDDQLLVEGDVLTAYHTKGELLSLEPGYPDGQRGQNVEAVQVPKHGWKVILAAAATFIAGALFAGAAVFLAVLPDPNSTIPADAAVGVCFSMPDEPYGPSMFVSERRAVRVDCAEPHQGQVIGRSGFGESCEDILARFEVAYSASVSVDHDFMGTRNCIIARPEADLVGSYVDGGP